MNLRAYSLACKSMESDSKHGWLHTLGGQAAILSSAMLVLWAIVVGISWLRCEGGISGVAALSAAVCYFAAIFALASEKAFSGNGALFGMLLSMAIRTGIPLAAVVCMKKWGGRFAEPEAVVYLVIFYFAALITHVALSCHALNSNSSEAIRHSPAK